MNDSLSPELIQAQQNERQALRVNVTKLGILFILYDLIFTYFSKKVFVYLYYAVSEKSLNFDTKTVQKFLDSNLDTINSSMFKMSFSCFVIVLSLIMLLITARIMNIRVLNTIKFSKKNAKLGLIAFPVGLVINTALTAVTTIITKLFSTGGTTIPTADFSVDSPSAKAIIFTAMYLVIVAPIAEEIVFRGLILKVLSPYGVKNAILLSAILFGLMHKNIPQAIGAFAIGIVFAVVDTKANSILPSIIMHSLNNMLPCLMDINSSLKSPAVNTVYNLLVNIIVFAGIAIIFIKGRKLFSLKEETASEKTALSVSQKRITVFLNPVIVIYLAILIFYMISSIIIANQ